MSALTGIVDCWRAASPAIQSSRAASENSPGEEAPAIQSSRAASENSPGEGGEGG